MLRMARSLHEGPVHHLLQVGVVLLLHIGGDQIADLTGGQGAVLQCTVDGVAAEGTGLDSLHRGNDHGGVIGDLGADDALVLAQDVGGLADVVDLHGTGSGVGGIDGLAGTGGNGGGVAEEHG